MLALENSVGNTTNYQQTISIWHKLHEPVGQPAIAKDGCAVARVTVPVRVFLQNGVQRTILVGLRQWLSQPVFCLAKAVFKQGLLFAQPRVNINQQF